MSSEKDCIFYHNIFELDNRATSMDFLKPKEAKAKLDPRDGWLFKLKSKFTLCIKKIELEQCFNSRL